MTRLPTPSGRAGQPGRRRAAGRDAGAVTAFVVILFPAFLGFGGLILDGGGALADKSDAIGIAQEAARAGAQQLDLTAFRQTGTVRLLPTQATAAARAFLIQAGANGAATATNASVTVTVTEAHHTHLLTLVGLSTLTVTGTGSAHPAPPAPAAGQ